MQTYCTQTPYILTLDISDNLSCMRLCPSTLTHITNHNMNYVDTSTLQRLNDAAISTKFEAILISQCMQTYCTRTPFNLTTLDITHNLSWTTRLCLSTLSHITNHIINYVHTSALQRLEDTAIITKIEAILISQCMQTYCTRKTLYNLTLDVSDNLSWTRLCLSTLSHTTETHINYVDSGSMMLQSERNSKLYSFHNACKRIA